ncbi:ATP-binding protein [Roseibacillus persicicus]|uniref:AAA family ATPase n=1 Tax=Roseibacillus persicicus TaxID=454148 RepID=UPI00398B1E19
MSEANSLVPIMGSELLVNKTQMTWLDRLANADRENVRFLADWCNRNLKTTAELGTLLRQSNGTFYSPDSVRKFFRGARVNENMGPILQSIADWVKLEREREGQATHDHVDTRTNKRIHQVCRKALRRSEMGFVFGDARIGKTWGLKNFMKTESSARVVYVEVTGASLGSFLRELLEAFGVKRTGSFAAMEQELIARFDKNTLLIVDEAQNGFPAKSYRTAPPVFRFLKTLWNKTQCPIVISMTDEGLQEMLNGPQKKFFEQILGRKCAQAKLPRKLPDDDLDRFAAHYGLPPAPDRPSKIKVETMGDDGELRTSVLTENPYALQSMINSTEGLAIWICLLRDANDLAKDQGKRITWGAVIRAHAAMTNEERTFE